MRWLCLFAFYFGYFIPCQAHPNQPISLETGVSIDGAICIEAETGNVLLEKQADLLGHPASVTKLMTLLLVLEDIQAGKTSLNTPVTVTDEAARQGGSQVWLATGETFSTEALLYAMMLHSANDASVALALHRESSVQRFVQRMNQRAQQLGMSRTRFVTPNGLTYGAGPHDTTTARDLTKLAQTLCQFPEALNLTAKKDYLFRPGPRAVILGNHNRLLNSFPGCDGMKTGWTVAANASIVTTAKVNGRRVITVVLGCKSEQGAKPSQRARDRLAADLMTKGLTALAKTEAPKVATVASPSSPLMVAKQPPKEDNFWDFLAELF